MGYWNDEDGDCSEGGNTTADGDNSKGDEAVDVSEARNQRQQPTSARPNNSTSVYQRACQRLIDKVVRASGGVGPSTRVLDVGYGCGDQDLYLYDKYDCWHIDGITLEPAQHQLAQAHTRIRRLDDTILLRTGDAADPNDDSGVWQSGQKYDRIFAIDCAYHFATRDQFLSNVANSLESGNGSTFVAADILPTFVPDQTDSVGRFIMRVISKVAGVPVENMYTADEYRIKLEKLGFEQVRIEDITSNVFPGLADYIEDHISTMSSVVRPSKTLPLTVMKWILRFLYEQQWCQFVIISAKMP
ncbi:S-adenosyl-L-methionine-dependent methyltransferase [Ramicandelaber brevisporus]|nr:S-adenosyl-L-methionine-dependent methyltransferase [Ramicandelaber brevisporus]